LRDGIGLGMLSEDHPLKRDDLLKDIPDNKAFYPCADDGAKSHLKWAEGFGYFWAPKVTKCLDFSHGIAHGCRINLDKVLNKTEVYISPRPFGPQGIPVK